MAAGAAAGVGDGVLPLGCSGITLGWSVYAGPTEGAEGSLQKEEASNAGGIQPNASPV